ITLKHHRHPPSDPNLKSRSCDQSITDGENNGGGRSEASPDLDLTEMVEYRASSPSYLTSKCTHLVGNLFLHHCFSCRKNEPSLSPQLPSTPEYYCINTTYFVF
ncbi:hypothetical protein A4A49_62369, partial [Nicotiana attenuata]